MVCISCGPSLTQQQVDRVARAGVKTIVVNDAYLLAPWADVNYFADLGWWKWQMKGIEKPLLGLTTDDVRERFASFRGEKCSIQHPGKEEMDPAVHLLRNGGVEGISTEPDAVKTGNHSGYQALNIPPLAGATRIVLLGYDGKFSSGGKPHFFGDHPERTFESVVVEYSKAFRTMENPMKDLGIEVLNASPGSAIPYFPLVDLEQALQSNVCEVR